MLVEQKDTFLGTETGDSQLAMWSECYEKSPEAPRPDSISSSFSALGND